MTLQNDYVKYLNTFLDAFKDVKHDSVQRMVRGSIGNSCNWGWISLFKAHTQTTDGTRSAHWAIEGLELKRIVCVG